MTTVVGGLRRRCIYDSIYYEVLRFLTEIGWFDLGRRHKAIVFRATAVDNEDPIPLNTMCLVADDDILETEVEMGSNYSDFSYRFYIDFYAEDDSLGEHVAYDIRDCLQGRMPSVDRDTPTIDLLNYSLPTPTQIGTLDIQYVSIDRIRNVTHPWQKHWFSVGFTVVDTYGNEDDN